MASFLTSLTLNAMLVTAPLLGISMTDLGFPSTDEFTTMLKSEIMEIMEIATANLVPAIGFSLVIRKITS